MHTDSCAQPQTLETGGAGRVEARQPTIRGLVPPPPHDPLERVVVAMTDAWEIRQFAEGDPRLAYFTPRAFRHIQLWHPDAQVSILTPSKLTAGAFEAWTPTLRFATHHWEDVVCTLPHVILPGAAQVRAFEHWFVTVQEPRRVRLLRHLWRNTRRRQEA